MQITTIGLDIAKNVFQVHGIDAKEKVVARKQLRRSQIADSDDPGQGFQFEGGHHSNRRRAVLPVGTFMGSQRW
jgi:hypothetical protein